MFLFIETIFNFIEIFNSIISVNSRIVNNLYVEVIPEIPEAGLDRIC